jgi:hypothetical protein
VGEGQEDEGKEEGVVALVWDYVINRLLTGNI